MKCHHTIDNLAGAVRNLVPSWTGFPGTNPVLVKLAREIPIRDREHHYLLSENEDKNFAHTLPVAQLNFRNVDQRLISYDFTGLDDLGKFLASSKDFHYCMTKRYVKYLTGYDFDVQAHDSSWETKEFQALANNFYAHGDQKKLIADILASPLFTDGASTP
jgi:hypothetical protein